MFLRVGHHFESDAIFADKDIFQLQRGVFAGRVALSVDGHEIEEGGVADFYGAVGVSGAGFGGVFDAEAEDEAEGEDLAGDD